MFSPFGSSIFRHWYEWFAAVLPKSGDLDSNLLAANAFDSFIRAASSGRFPKLNDRHDLWRLLILISVHKISKQLRGRSDRNGSHIQGELDELVGPGRTPDFIASIAEEWQALLDSLDNDGLRQVAILKMEGYKIQEIAASIGKTRQTVTNRLDQIGKILRSRGKQ